MQVYGIRCGDLHNTGCKLNLDEWRDDNGKKMLL